MSHILRPPLTHVKTNSITRILDKVCTKSVYVYNFYFSPSHAIVKLGKARFANTIARDLFLGSTSYHWLFMVVRRSEEGCQNLTQDLAAYIGDL